jgi:DNA-binding NarL/FixJ family response regulator
LIRIDILDSSPIFIAGLRTIFTQAGFKVVGIRTDSSQKASWAADLFIVDPTAIIHEEPVHFIGSISRLSPVLVLLAPQVPDAGLVPTLTKVGARGFLARNSSAHVLIEAVEAVANGSSFDDSVVGVAENCEDVSPPWLSQELSPREKQVLSHIAHGATHSQVARRLGISRHTVDTYVKRIRTKIDAGNKADLTRAAILSGLG